MKSQYPHVALGNKYVDDVLHEKIPACKWVKLACERHILDTKRAAKRTAAWRYGFDPERAERVMRFKEVFPHTKGKWAKENTPYVLEPWQCFKDMSTFGWVDRETDNRRFRRSMLIVPRKNGKSDDAARTGLYMLAADGEFGAEVYSGATTEKQAFEVYKPAWKMANVTPLFQEYYAVDVPVSFRSPLTISDNGSLFSPIIGKPGDGASPSCAITDEYHEHQSDEQLDTMETGMGAREQALSIIISTAGDNLGGPCHALQLELQKILERVNEDEEFWGIIYTIDGPVRLPSGKMSKGDDPFCVESLIKANPNYDVSVSGEFLQKKMKEAIRQSRKQGIYQTKHLDVWMGARTAFFNVQSWIASAKSLPEEHTGRSLCLGLDLASTKDIASLTGTFELEDGRYATFGRHYVPEAAIEGEENSLYAGWARDGHLIVTEGNMIDYTRIEEDVLEICKEHAVLGLGFDPAYAQMMIQRLMAEGIECIVVRPTVLNFSEPMKVVDALIASGKLEHEHNPAMAWMMSNVVAKVDNKDNVYPNKEKPESKIDGPVSMLMSFYLLLSGGLEPSGNYSVTVID